MITMRIVVPLLLSIIVGFNSHWLRGIYRLNSNQLSLSGDLSQFYVPCESIPVEIKGNCKRGYRVPRNEIKSETDILSFGVGVLQGASTWYCENDSKYFKIYETGNKTSKTSLRAGLFQYEIANVPIEVCKKDLIIVSFADSQNPSGAIGWKSGAFISGTSVAVSAFKAANDFFASYFRAFLGVIALLFLLIFETIFCKNPFGTYWYRRAMAFFSIHFIASSSILEFLVPNSLGLGFPLLSAGGSGGAFLLILSSLEIFLQRELFRNSFLVKSKTVLVAFFLSLFGVYYSLGGGIYINIQWALAAILFFVSIKSQSPLIICFALLFNIDVLAVKGVFPGFPSNSATHFLFFSFIYDSFEWIIQNSSLMNRINKNVSVQDLDRVLGDFATRFSLNRVTVSVFSDNLSFKTFRILPGAESVLEFENEKVSPIAASVMTARIPAVRVRLGSSQSKKLLGIDNKENFSKGSEFCSFPMVHAQKVVGVLNVTGYSALSLGDPSQMDLFLSMLDRLIPRLAETYYRRDLSPLVEEQKRILEVESTFSSNKDKGKIILVESLDLLSQVASCKIIVSEAFPAQNKLLAYSSHCYAIDDAKILETHAPALNDVLVTSPSNIAYSRREVVYISDVKRMISLYSNFVVSLFERNQTKCLYVAPILLCSIEAPWGVMWLEFSNPLNRSDEDLKDLAEFVCASVQRQLIAHLDYEKERRLALELSSLIPEHVLAKIKSGQNPREEEIGYLLNIDLTGSTKLAGQIGDKQFEAFVRKVSLELSKRLRVFGFVEQMIIWDAFIFTCKADAGSITRRDIDSIREVLRASIDEAKQSLTKQCSLSFRAVLHYGDTTRDFKQSETKTWGIVGAALAESCKMESAIKGQTEIVFVSDSCLADKKLVRAA